MQHTAQTHEPVTSKPGSGDALGRPTADGGGQEHVVFTTVQANDLTELDVGS